jgi:phosphoribosylformylglycinamidine synthase
MLKRVVEAVRDYGNRMGIPTNNGSFHFHDDFRAKPTVLVGAYGILPKKKAKIGKPISGDIVVSVGGRVGRDGIHGATFSSGEMTDRTITVNAQAVQIGNAIEEKRMFDAIEEASEQNLIRAIQDSGGGGLSSAVGEIGASTGVRVQLKNERLKYPGLSPWEIWLSESQERMIAAIPKEKFSRFKKICQKYNVEFSELGKFLSNRKLEVLYGDEVVCSLDMEFLHKGLPQRKMSAIEPKKRLFTEKLLKIKKNEWSKALRKVLSNGNVCSKEAIVRLYDHTVQGTNVVQQYSGVENDGPNDAAVIRPLLDKNYGMIVSHGLNPALNNIDSYWGSIWAGVEALSNYVAVGGDFREASLINNYVWPFPDEESLWTLDRSVDAVIDLMKIFKTPVISGKDSLSSTYRGKDGTVIKIPPVLCISAFGRVKNVLKTQTADFKKPGSVI